MKTFNADDGDRWRKAREELRARCCGDCDASGTCFAPACRQGEALKAMDEMWDHIEDLERRLKSGSDTNFAQSPRVICHAPGDRCGGCDHYHGRAPICIYAADATVPELRTLSGETPRTDSIITGGTIGQIALLEHARQLERELAEAKQQRANTFAELLEAEEKIGELQAAARSTTGRLQPELLDERFTGKYIEDFVDRWAEGKAASDQSAFTEDDIQRLLDFAVDLTNGLTGEDFFEFVGRILETASATQERSDG